MGLAGLACLAALVLMISVIWTVLRELADTRAAIRRCEIIVAEARRMHRIGLQIAEAQQISETTLSLGSQLVRTLHQGIASIPFGILEAIPVTRHTTRVVRASHDLIAGAVYDSIDAVNREIGVQLRGRLERSGQGAPTRTATSMPSKTLPGIESNRKTKPGEPAE